MFQLSQWSVRKKILAGFWVIMAWLALVGAGGVYGIFQVNQRLDETLAAHLPAMDHLQAAERNFHRSMVSQRVLVTAPPIAQGLRAVTDQYDKSLSRATDHWQAYKAMVSTGRESALAQTVDSARRAWMSTARRISTHHKAATPGDRQTARELAQGRSLEEFSTMQAALSQLSLLGRDRIQSARASAQAFHNRAVVLIGGVTLVVFLSGVMIMGLVSRKVLDPLDEVLVGIRDIADGGGDFTRRLPVTGEDEAAALAAAFNTFLENIHTLTMDISQEVEGFSRAAGALVTLSDEMGKEVEDSSGCSEQLAASAGKMASGMDEISAVMAQASENANTVASAAGQMDTASTEIAVNTDQARDISQEAVAKAAASRENVKELGAAAQSIDMVLEAVADISERVNLLALNATIEAARAGDAGKGFAVVASEIKALALQTSDASRDIRGKIENIQSGVRSTLDRIQGINQVNTKSNEFISAIAASVEEQSAMAEEISQNINQTADGIAQVTTTLNRSALSARQMESEISRLNSSTDTLFQYSQDLDARSRQLSQMAQQLDNTVARFKI